MRLTKTVTAAVATAALGVAAGLGLSQAGGDDPPAPWSPSSTNAAVPATLVEKAAFGRLAASARTQDAANALVETLATRSGIGVDAAGARVVGATDTGPLWLIPANGGLCLGIENTADGSLGTACEPAVDVIARGLTVGDGTHIYGVAPDNATVTVTPAGGTATAVTVGADGAYTLPSQDATVAVGRPLGVTQFEVVG